MILALLLFNEKLGYCGIMSGILIAVLSFGTFNDGIVVDVVVSVHCSSSVNHFFLYFVEGIFDGWLLSFALSFLFVI